MPTDEPRRQVDADLVVVSRKWFDWATAQLASIPPLRDAMEQSRQAVIMTRIQSEQLVGVKVLAERFGPPPSWWYVKSERGEVPSYRLGKYRRFKLSEVEAWVAQQRQGVHPENGMGGP
jgi:hypothetical protein